MKTSFRVSVIACLTVLSACSGVTTPQPLEPTGPTAPSPARPAELKLTAQASKSVISVGQDFAVTVTVTNSGESLATAVMPTTPQQSGNGHAMLKTSPLPIDIAGGQAATFTFTWEATDPGAVVFDVGADGTDLEHSRTVNAPATHLSIIVEGAAILAVDSIDLPAIAVVGVDFTVKMKVSNGGQSSANEVTPGALQLSGTGTAQLVSGPTPASATLAHGASTDFTWTYRPQTAGTLKVVGAAAGLDGNSNAPITAMPATSSTSTIHTPAALTAMMSVPSQLSGGQVFTATLVVTNTGTATAKGVLPSPLIPTATVVNGAAGAVATVAPAAVDIPGGGTAVFTWQYTASGVGAVSLTASAKGIDEATDQPVASASAKSGTANVLAPPTLQVVSFSAPSTVNRGQTFTLQMTVKNTGGAAITDVLPNPNPPALTASGAGTAALSTVTAQTIAAGATATFSWQVTENGSAVGSLSWVGAARGTISSGTVNSNPSSSNLVVVVRPPGLMVDSVTVPAKVSRGQTFPVTVSVRNTGGSSVANALPALTITAADMAGATVVTSPVASTLAGGASKVFTYSYREDGSGVGSLKFNASATATDAASGNQLNAPLITSASMTVETPASLTISAFALPATVNRGQTFAVSLTVSNSGGAAATNVVAMPNPPRANTTGGVIVATTSTNTPVTVAGNSSQTFTWLYSESGTAPGTVSFTAQVQGLESNSGAVLTVANATTNVSAVATQVGCNSSQLYTGFGGFSLDGDRVDAMVGLNRLRILPYDMLVTEFARVLGTTPTSIQGQGSTFNTPPARWDTEPELSAVSLYQAFSAAFQGCLAFTGTPAAYSANPTAATASAECTNLQRRFWSRTSTSAEVSACVNFATGTANNDTNPRRRWAYTCASILTSTGFLTR